MEVKLCWKLSVHTSLYQLFAKLLLLCFLLPKLKMNTLFKLPKPDFIFCFLCKSFTTHIFHNSSYILCLNVINACATVVNLSAASLCAQSADVWGVSFYGGSWNGGPPVFVFHWHDEKCNHLTIDIILSLSWICVLFDEFIHAVEETHFCCLYFQSHSFSHYSQLMTMDVT